MTALVAVTALVFAWWAWDLIADTLDDLGPGVRLVIGERPCQRCQGRGYVETTIVGAYGTEEDVEVYCHCTPEGRRM